MIARIRHEIEKVTVGLMACAMILVWSPSAKADVIVRAVGDHVSPETIEYVARNALAHVHFGWEFRDPSALSFKDVIRLDCGSVQDAYVEVFKDLNQLPQTFDVDDIVGRSLPELVWPACLRWVTYTSSVENINLDEAYFYTVRNGDSAAILREKFTGRQSPRSSQYFFLQKNGQRVVTPQELNKLKIGDKLLIAHRTFPVQLKPVSPMSNQEFIDGLKSTINNLPDAETNPRFKKYAKIERFKDEIIFSESTPIKQASVQLKPSLRKQKPNIVVLPSVLPAGFPDGYSAVPEGHSHNMGWSVPALPSVSIHDVVQERVELSVVHTGIDFYQQNLRSGDIGNRVTNTAQPDMNDVELSAEIADPNDNHQAGTGKFDAFLVAGELESDHKKFCTHEYYKSDGTLIAGNPPVDRDLLLKTLKLAMAASKRSIALAKKHTAHVLIIDNGFLGIPCTNDAVEENKCDQAEGHDLNTLGADFMPASYFATGIWKDKNADEIFFGPVTSVDRITGYANLYRQLKGSDNIILKQSKFVHHGTHVVSVLLGGNWVKPKDREEIYRVLKDSAAYRIAIANVGSGKHRVQEGFLTSIDNILSATRLAFSQQLDIVNMSFTLTHQSDTWDLLAESFGVDFKNTLFVVAAGNDGKTIAEYEVPIASAGGIKSVPAFPGNVLTVGSHDANGAISLRSNRSHERVDILAPGCGIFAAKNGDGQGMIMSGTSQAAPIVSQGASLLKFMTKWSPRQIINRFYMSGDFDFGLEKKVASRSIVNIEKALLMFHDYLEFERVDPQTRTGQKYKVVGGKGDWAGNKNEFFCVRNGIIDKSNPKSWKKILAIKTRKSSQSYWAILPTGSQLEDVEFCEMALEADDLANVMFEFEVLNQNVNLDDDDERRTEIMTPVYQSVIPNQYVEIRQESGKVKYFLNVPLLEVVELVRFGSTPQRQPNEQANW